MPGRARRGTAWRNIAGLSQPIFRDLSAQRRRSSPPARASACTRRCRKCCTRWPAGRWSRHVLDDGARAGAAGDRRGRSATAAMPSRRRSAAPDLTFVRPGSAARHRRRRARRARRAAAGRRHAGRTRRRSAGVRAERCAASSSMRGSGDVGAPDGARAAIPPGSAASCATPPAACARSSRSGTRRPPSARSTRSTPASSRRRPRCCRAGSSQLTPHNAQGEFYLTDIVAMAVAEGVPRRRARCRRRARRARHQRPRAARDDRADRRSVRRARRAARSRRVDRRSGAHRHARHARLRPRCAHRRRLRVRGRR